MKGKYCSKSADLLGKYAVVKDKLEKCREASNNKGVLLESRPGSMFGD